MDLAHELNPEQRRAVEETEGPLLVLAGAGSGKTRVITYRIAHLIRDLGVDPWGIFAVTFTNKAAAQMAARVEQLLGSVGGGYRGGKGPGSLWISTFHAACVRILRRDIERLGYSSRFVIYDDKEQLAVLKDVLQELGISDRVLDPRSAASKLDQLKNAGHLPDSNWEMPFQLGEDRLREIYRRYQGRLQQMNALDFGDLLLQSVRLFEGHPEVLEDYRAQFQYLHVDEYQDTNRVQYRLIRLLCEPRHNICVVGDDDQSIYRWRGADLSNILDFENDFPGTKVIRLEQNYRSTEKILAAANAVIAHNQERKGKVLWTKRATGKAPVYYLADDEHEEALFVAQEISKVRDESQLHWRDVAIFYRTNAQSRVLEEELLKRRIPYAIVGGQKFYDRAEVKNALGYVRLLVNPADDMAFLRIVNTPARGIGDTTTQKLQAFARERGRPLLEAAGLAVSEGALGSGPQKKLESFLALHAQLAKIAGEFGPSDLLRSILIESGYVRSLEEDGSVEARGRLENLDELVNAVAEYEEQEDAPTAAGFLERVALVSDLDSYAEDLDRMVLMTLHTAKGLEFPVVFLTGLEEGLFPHERSTLDDESLEEERRLCYVGITRARDQLYLTAAAERRVFGQTFVNEPSRFLREIPPEMLDCRGLAVEGAKPRLRAPRWRERPAWLSGAGAGEEAPLPSTGRPAPRAAASLTFPLGCRVEHPTFGQGIVKESSLAGGQEKVTVAFARAGTKKLMVKFANLKKA